VSVQVRRAQNTDLEHMAAIQAASPEASQWEPADYLRYETCVAAAGPDVIGFVAYRTVAPAEHELLNIAVAPAWRRRGIGRALIETVRQASPGTWFIEVRESNRASRQLFATLGFTEIGLRKEYYSNPSESGIVMRFLS